MQQPPFVYPSSDLDQGRALIAVLGNFWSRMYTAKDQVASFTAAGAVLAAQTHRNILEAIQALSRFDVPVFHTQLWTPIVLKKSSVTYAKVINNFFDENQAIFDSNAGVFGGVVDRPLYYFPLPTDLVNVGQIFNKLIFPTTTLQQNIDYVIDRKSNALVFVNNPFDNDGFDRKNTADALTGVVDEEILLWGFSGQFDYKYVLDQFAYAVGIQLTSSEGYKALTNSVISGLISGGASAAELDLALAAICGIPLVIEDRETVEEVSRDNNGLFVATDKHVYRFSADAAPVVTVGQVVFGGEQLVDGFKIDELFTTGDVDKLPADTDPSCCQPLPRVLAANDTTVHTNNGREILVVPRSYECDKKLKALALDRGFLSACFYGDLVFEGIDTPLIVDTNHPSGYTYVKFNIAGLPADVDAFFDEIHRRGVAAAEAAKADPCPPGTGRYTLAHFLDRRVRLLTEPGPQHLPATINPLRFLIENVLRNNVFTVRLTMSALGPNRLGLYNVRHLRQLLPPGAAMLLVCDLQSKTDVIASKNFVDEQLQFFTGTEPLADTLTDEYVSDMGVTVHLISGTCQ